MLTLQILGGVFAVLLLVLAGLAVVANSPSIQKKVLHKANEMLSERLGTKTSIDSVYIDVLRQDLRLYGVDIDDRQQRKLFEIEQMVVDLDLTKLLADKIEVERARIAGLRANLIDNPGEEPNYQSILDALKKDKALGDTTKRKSKLKFDLRDVKPYLRHLSDYPLPLAAAYPVFSWLRTIHAVNVEHTVEADEILRVKHAVEQERPTLSAAIITYHLDKDNINRYKPETYEEIYHH